MRPLVQQKVPSVIRGGLVVHPQSCPDGNPVYELVISDGRHESQCIESATLADQMGLRLPIGGFRGIDLEVIGPLRHGAVKDLRQAVDFRAGWQIRVQHEVSALDATNHAGLS
jgi:hypothetical protein